MSDDREMIPPAPGGAAPDAADLGEIAKKQWEQALQAFGKTTTAMAAGTPFMPGGVPFPMQFPGPFMLPGLMQYGLNPFFQAAAAFGADQDALAGGPPSDAIIKDEEGATTTTAAPPSAAATTLKRRPSRAASLPQKKAKPAEQRLGVRSQSQAALALLASAAGDAFPSSSDLQEPPSSLKTEGTLPALPPLPPLPQPPQPTSQGDEGRSGGGGGGGSANLPTRKMSLDLSLDAGDDDDYALMNTAGLDERELKKLRRKQSNRESARRSRLKKQEECDTLQRENRELRDEIEQLKSEKVELAAQVAILNAKLSMAGVLGAMQQQQHQPPSSTLPGAGAGESQQPQSEVYQADDAEKTT